MPPYVVTLLVLYFSAAHFIIPHKESHSRSLFEQQQQHNSHRLAKINVSIVSEIMVSVMTSNVNGDNLSENLVKMLADPPFARRLSEQGQDPQSSTPAELTAYMRAETERWTGVLKSAGFLK